MQVGPYYRPTSAGTSTSGAPGRWHAPMAVLMGDGTYAAGCAACVSPLAWGVDEDEATAAVLAHVIAANTSTSPEAALLGVSPAAGEGRDAS